MLWNLLVWRAAAARLYGITPLIAMPVRQRATSCMPEEESKIRCHLSTRDHVSAAGAHSERWTPVAYGGSKSLIFYYTQYFAEEGTRGAIASLSINSRKDQLHLMLNSIK